MERNDRPVRSCSLALLSPAVSLSSAQQTPKIGVLSLPGRPGEVRRRQEGHRPAAGKGQSQPGRYHEARRRDPSARDQVNTQRLTLSEEALYSMSADLQKSRPTGSGVAEDASRDFQDLQVKLFNKVQSELIPIIESLGRRKASTSSWTWPRAEPSISTPPST